MPPSSNPTASPETSRQTRFPSFLLFMVVVALAIRLVVMVFLLPEQLEPQRDHWNFGYEAGRIARSIVQGRGFSSPLFEDTGPTAWMTPVYPYVVAGVFKLFGIYTKTSAIVLLSLNALTSALACVLVFLIARASFGERVAKWSGWAWAVCPYAIYFPVERIWETWLATLLLCLIFLITLNLENESRFWRWAAFGLLWGLAALTSPALLIVLPFLAGWVIYRRHRRGQRWFAVNVVAAIAFIAVISPWFIRNYEVFHRFVPFRDGMGLVLRLGTKGNNDYWGPYELGPWHNDQEWNEFKQLGELRYMEKKQQQAIEFIRANPGWYARTSVRRAIFLWTGYWSLDRSYLKEEPFDPPNILFCTALTVLALLGLWRALRANCGDAMPYALVLFSFPLIYYITSPELYYRRPMDPFFVILAVAFFLAEGERSQFAHAALANHVAGAAKYRTAVATSSPISNQPRVPSFPIPMVLVALALRLVVMGFLYQEQLDPELDHWRFSYENGRLARSIAEGRGFSGPLFEDTGKSAWMTPLYPYLTAGVFKVFGIYTTASAFVLLSMQCLISALNCLPIFYIALKLFGRQMALWSGWAWAFFPYAIYFPAERIWSTWLSTALFSVLFLWTLYLEKSTRLSRWIGIGLLWGLTALTDPIVMAAWPFMNGWTCYRMHRQKQRWAAPLAASVLAMVAIVSPWFIRNYEVFGKVIPFRDNAGLELHIGNSGDTFHWRPRWVGPWHNDEEWKAFKELGEIRYMEREKQRGMEFIRSHPRWVAIVTVRRLVYIWTGFWSFDKRYLAEEPLDPPNVFFCTALTVMMLIGLRRLWRENRSVAVLFAMVLFFFPAIYYVTHVEVYFRRQIDPLILVLALYGVLRKTAGSNNPWTEARPVYGPVSQSKDVSPHPL